MHKPNLDVDDDTLQELRRIYSKPRDPARINRILDKLSRVWNNSPDWRLGQLVVNAMSAGSLDPQPDTFMLEDDRLEQGLDLLIERFGETEVL